MAFWDSQETIKEIQKNKLEKVVVSHCIRDKNEYTDIRVHKRNGTDTEEYKPTTKGVTMAIDLIGELLGAIEEIIG